MGTAISIYLSRCTLSFLVCSRYTEREREGGGGARKACHDWSKVFTGYEVLLCFL
jgi:hypothetical protein